MFQIPISVPGSLAIIPRPRGGDWLNDEIVRLRQGGVGVVVSLLCESENIELGLEEEAAACSSHRIDFVSLPVPDLSVPADAGQFIETVQRLAARVCGGSRVVVHCRQSIGRSGLLAVSVAIACGMSLQAALDAVSRSRGLPVPETKEQKDWLRQNERLLSQLRLEGNTGHKTGPGR